MSGSAKMLENLQHDYFAANVLDPSSWVAKADDLWNAAELLFPALEACWRTTQRDPNWKYLGGDPPLGLNSIWLMLSAYALENLFKAAIVAGLSSNQKAQVQASGKLPNGMASHKLVSLASKAKISLSPDEAAELERMADAAVVFGRYPVPKESAVLFANEPSAMASKDANAVVEADLRVPGELYRRVRGRFS